MQSILTPIQYRIRVVFSANQILNPLPLPQQWDFAARTMRLQVAALDALLPLLAHSIHTANASANFLSMCRKQTNNKNNSSKKKSTADLSYALLYLPAAALGAAAVRAEAGGAFVTAGIAVPTGDRFLIIPAVRRG